MDATLEQRTLLAEDRLWWYRGRRAIVLDAARRLLPGTGERRILDVGCGGGAELVPLSRLGSVVGVEPSPASREVAEARGAGPVLDLRIEDLDLEEASFDLALALDVIEHIDDDVAALAQMLRHVRPGGGLVVTVPAHERLWSRHDELNEHRRRYSRATLAAAATEAGWRPGRLTHFNALLLPVALVARRGYRSDGLDIPPAPVNRALEGTLQAERLAIRAGLRLPVGLSLLAELRRPPDGL